jgi:predicted transcriptional regulator
MFELFKKECKMIALSLVYFIFIGVVVALWLTQFFAELPTTASQQASSIKLDKSPVKRTIIQEPVYVKDLKAYYSEHKEYPYGTVYEEIAEQIVPKATRKLLNEYCQGSYVAYPIGFIKYVKLNKTDTEKIEAILIEITGINIDKLKKMNNSESLSEILANININYDRFKELMEEASSIVGVGSNYSKENLLRLGLRPKTYEEAMKEYKDLIYGDKITNAYARLFSDYLGIVLGLFPAFVVVFYMMRDKKSNMHELIYYRKVSSFKLIVCRYVALVWMMMVPVLVLAVISTVQFLGIGDSLKVSIDYFAFIKYSFAWLLPTVMAVTALGMLLTVLTESVLAILIQIVWFFMAMASAGLGGNYALMQLIIRFNTPGERQLFISNFNSILLNRLFYVVLSATLLALSVYILNLKRIGRIDIYGRFRKYSSIVKGKFKGSLSE